MSRRPHWIIPQLFYVMIISWCKCAKIYEWNPKLVDKKKCCGEMQAGLKWTCLTARLARQNLLGHSDKLRSRNLVWEGEEEYLFHLLAIEPKNYAPFNLPSAGLWHSRVKKRRCHFLILCWLACNMFPHVVYSSIFVSQALFIEAVQFISGVWSAPFCVKNIIWSWIEEERWAGTNVTKKTP